MAIVIAKFITVSSLLATILAQTAWSPCRVFAISKNGLPASCIVACIQYKSLTYILSSRFFRRAFHLGPSALLYPPVTTSILKQV